MARVNKCKKCGTGPDLPAGVEWVGTNHNLCSECADYRSESERRAIQPMGRPSTGMASLGIAMALGLIASAPSRSWPKPNSDGDEL